MKKDGHGSEPLLCDLCTSALCLRARMNACLSV